MMPGPKELFFIFLIILLIFGAKRIPEIMRALGRGLGEFRKARDDFEEALNSSTSEHADKQKTTTDSSEKMGADEKTTDDKTHPESKPQSS